MTPLHPGARDALAVVVAQFPGLRVITDADGQGGTFVTVHDIPIAGPYVQGDTWLGFHISHLVPDADVYPHYVRPDLVRRDGRPHDTAMQEVSWRDRPALQISRRSHNPLHDARHAAVKAAGVLRWLELQ